ncbi:unnamed protein product [Parnassius mnemosyne]|uniref:Integrase catalytic domain-containing protein n=1 Tax=Parnassius mnemosyne TaxID=213953 RepID=A0AAV1KV74_9NEOP
MVDQSTQSHILALKQVFSRWGIPTKLCTDDASQFNSYEFQEFVKEWGFHGDIEDSIGSSGISSDNDNVQCDNDNIQSNDTTKNRKSVTFENVNTDIRQTRSGRQVKQPSWLKGHVLY